jgi:hypothetical protein
MILCAKTKKNLDAMMDDLLKIVDAMMDDLMKIVDASFYLNVP